jgi:hypothetical protein
MNNRLHEDLARARDKAELLITMRQEREELDTRCQH